MTKYQITQRVSGVVLGIYEGDTPDQALDACARDAGYSDFDEELKVTGETRETQTLEIESLPDTSNRTRIGDTPTCEDCGKDFDHCDCDDPPEREDDYTLGDDPR